MTASLATEVPAPEPGARIPATQSRRSPPQLACLRGVTKRFGPVIALSGFDLEVRQGEVLAVLGANGAGKTTALALLTGRLGADAGAVSLFGRDPRDPIVRRGIGVMLQDGKLPDTLQVAEQIRLFSSYYPNPRPLADTIALSGLEGLGKRRYSALSGGQQRRVQFALAICGRPRLLFVDEPTVGLDVQARRNFWQVLRTLRDDGTGIVLTTHYLEEADALADRVVLMAAGRTLAHGSPAAIKAQALGKRVIAVTGVAAAELARWPEVEAVEARDGRTHVRSRHSEALLRRWLAADPRLSDLQVLPLSLDDAFLSLTSQEPQP